MLIPTQQAYLGYACRNTDAAPDLRIQRRTWYGRLARIERLPGRGLDDQDTRTRLALALQGLGLLRGRQPTVPLAGSRPADRPLGQIACA